MSGSGTDINDSQSVDPRSTVSMRATVETINDYVDEIKCKLKDALHSAAKSEREMQSAIREAKKWHRMYEQAVKPEIRMVEGSDEALARAYVDACDKCDLLEERVTKAESLKHVRELTIRRQLAYLTGIKQRVRNVPIDVRPHRMKHDVDLDRRRREGWLDMDTGFPGYGQNRKSSRR